MSPTLTQTRTLQWSDEDVDMEDWCMPGDYDVDAVCQEITHGPGFVLLKRMFGDKDLEMARERVMPSATKPSVETFSAKESSQNNFGGLSWGLLCRGRIFAKLATHPVILEVMMMIPPLLHGLQLLGWHYRLWNKQISLFSRPKLIYRRLTTTQPGNCWRRA